MCMRVHMCTYVCVGDIGLKKGNQYDFLIIIQYHDSVLPEYVTAHYHADVRDS